MGAQVILEALGQVRCTFVSADSIREAISPHLNPKCTYLFELCCQENRIVTEYSSDRVFLIGTREKDTGRHYTKQELDELAARLGVYRPKVFSFKELNITNLKQAKEFVNQEALKQQYGKASD